MYAISCDHRPVHYLSKNLKLINPKLVFEDNQISRLSFTIPVNHPAYQYMSTHGRKFHVFRDNVEIFEGVLTEEKQDFRKNKICTCEGELGYLKRTTQPQKEYHDMTVRGFLSTLLDEHNKMSEEKFSVGMVTVTDPNDSLYRFTNFETTLEAINKKLIQKLGGHLRIRKENGQRYLDYLADTVKTNTQTIEFGKNLIDFTKNFDWNEVVTSVIPLGAKLEEQSPDTSGKKALEKRVDICDINGGKNYLLNNALAEEIGFIQKVITFDDVTLPSNLMAKGKEYLREHNYENLVLEIKAIDLHVLNPDIEPIEVLDSVHVISKPHDLDKFFPVTKREIPLTHPEQETFTLGIKQNKSFTSIQGDSNNETNEKLDDVGANKQDFLNEAKQNASDLIHNALNGHVVTSGDEILIMDTDDKTTAQKLWRWNINGLGYSKTGYDGMFGTAITMDGQIVGDYIKADSIDVSKLSVQFRNDLKDMIRQFKVDINGISADVKGINEQMTKDYLAPYGSFTSQSILDWWDYEGCSLKTWYSRYSVFIPHGTSAFGGIYYFKTTGKTWVTFSASASEPLRTYVVLNGSSKEIKIDEVWKTFTFEIDNSDYVSIFVNAHRAVDIYIADIKYIREVITYNEARIKIQEDRIESEVTKGNLGTLIEQNFEHVRIAWNKCSNYIQFEQGKMNIYNGTFTTAEKRSCFDENGEHFWRDSHYVGKIGTNHLVGSSDYGLVFDLEQQGSYMGWASYDPHAQNKYVTKLVYANKRIGTWFQNSLNAGCDLDMHNFDIRNVNLASGILTNGTTTFTGQIPIITGIVPKSDGSFTYYESWITVKNGLITSAPTQRT